MGKNKFGSKKTPKSVNNYNNFIKKSNYSPEDTIDNDNIMLSGSEHVSHDEDMQTEAKIKKKPLKFKVKDNILQYIIFPFIVAILIAIASFCANFIFKTNANIAVINEKINSIEKSISTLENGYTNKENLQLQLDYIKNEIENEFIISVNDIKWRLNDIEKELNK